MLSSGNASSSLICWDLLPMVAVETPTAEAGRAVASKVAQGKILNHSVGESLGPIACSTWSCRLAMSLTVSNHSRAGLMSSGA